MGTDTKALRSRIKSVDSTLQLTKAMGLVASSKIRKANDAMLKSKEYLKNLESIIDILTACTECQKSTFMREAGKRRRIIVIAGDRGLAGGYNANVFRFAENYPDAEFIPIGKRACERFGKSVISSEYFTISDSYSLAKKLCADFTVGEYDGLDIISSRYISMMSQEPFIKSILPLSESTKKRNGTVVFEPDEITVLNMAVTEYTAGVISAAVRESFASETAARRTAMDSAGKNAEQMIDGLRLEYNRARQSTITGEITEIISGNGG